LLVVKELCSKCL